MYNVIHETWNYRVESSRMGDVILKQYATGREVYLQPGDEASSILGFLEAESSEGTVDQVLSEYFAS